MTTPQPELFRILTKQHRGVDGILTQLAAAADPESREGLFTVLKQQLLSHAKAEEKTFYGPLERAGEKRDAKHAKREHRDIEEAIAKVEAQGFDDGGWNKVVKDLTKTIKHHVEEEESEIFDAARESLAAETLDEIAEKFQQQRLVELEKLGGTDDGYDELTKEELLEQARERDVPGRSVMNRDELISQLRASQ